MVRGNWQKRVEAADARRKESQQRKQRADDRRLHKVWAHNLLQKLDRHHNTAQRPLRLRVWTDVAPTSAQPTSDGGDDGDDHPPGEEHDDLLASDRGITGHASKRRVRAVSLASEAEATNLRSIGGRKGRARSQSAASEHETYKSKKVHPRSHATIETSNDDDATPVRRLCKAHFFRGTCEGATRRKAGCSHQHYPSHGITLAAALLTVNSRRTSGDEDDSPQLGELQLAERAVEANSTEDGAMDMVHYAEIDITEPIGIESSPEVSPPSSPPPLSERLTVQLEEWNLKLSNIVYVVIGSTLVYDRNRGGGVLEDRMFVRVLAGEVGSLDLNRRVSSTSAGYEALAHLPGAVLEHMLTFLPDSAVSAASQVCRAWHHEIGQNSPNLWKHLLLRRQWPLPCTPNDTATHTAFRESFLQHYAAVRDINAIHRALGALVSKRAVDETEMSYQDFSTRKHSPSEPNGCVAIQIWSPRRILAAYSRDCSLRLFETVSRDRSPQLLCRQVLSRRVDPYQNTKRRSCSLLSMGLDDDAIGCLCHVMADHIDAEAYVLVVLTRDDFLVGDEDNPTASGGSHLHVIDIGEAVLNYLLSSEIVDHRVLQLLDFLERGRVGDVEVLVSRSLVACGYGRFMVEVSVSVPSVNLNEVAGGETVPMHLIDRKLVLFSATAGCIVWMGESNDVSRPLRPRHEDMSLSCLRRPCPGGSRASCTVLVASATTSAMLTASIDPTGQAEIPQLVEESDGIDRQVLLNDSSDEWALAPSNHRVVQLVSTDAIAVDVWHRTVNSRVIEHKSMVSFYPRSRNATEAPSTVLEIFGDVEVVRIASIRDRHILLLCREHATPTTTADPGDDNSPPVSIVAVLVDVEHKREIHRATLQEGAGLGMSDVPEISSVSEDTIGVGLSWKGVVMTGSAIRSVVETSVIVIENSSPNCRSVKKKKKKQIAKGSKKDGFARGMSLRG